MQKLSIMKRYFEEIWQKESKYVAREIVAPSVITRFPQSHGSGPDGVLKVVQERKRAFSSIKFLIIDHVSNKNSIWVRYRFTGKHTGTFWGIPASNKPVSYEAILMAEISNSRIVKLESIRDELSLLEQVGVKINIIKDNRQ